MDDIAFVNSLFDPSPRSFSQQQAPSPLVVSTSRSLATPMTKAGMDEDTVTDEMLRQLFSDQDFADSLDMPTDGAEPGEGEGGQEPSNLFEPLSSTLPHHRGAMDFALPALSPASAMSLRDVFRVMDMSPTPSPLSSPVHFDGGKTGTGTEATVAGRPDPHHTPRHSLQSGALMPVQPMYSAPSSSTNSVSAIQALQHAIWSNTTAGGFERLHPNSVKHVMMAATPHVNANNTNNTNTNTNTNTNNANNANNRYIASSGRGYITGSAPRNMTMPATMATMSLPPPQSQSQCMQLPPRPTPLSMSSDVPMWIPAALLTPTAPLSSAMPDLTRTISRKRSHARASVTTPTTKRAAVASASALAASLATQATTTAATKAKVTRTKPRVNLEDTVRSKTEVKKEPTGELLARGASKSKMCVEPGCIRRAQSNSRCKAHGGGARCQYAGPGGCGRSSQGGGFCRAHGGGKRCDFPGCTRGQQRKGRCYVHGGIRRCQTAGCEKKDRGNGFCISHGGGKRCTHLGCDRSVRRGLVCQLHEEQAKTRDRTTAAR